MKERNGVRVGERVRDLDGNDLGRVKELYAAAFSIVKGFPILFRQDVVARYDEVRGVQDGALVLARSGRDLLDLAAGGVPPAWRVEAGPEQPTAATPGEAPPFAPLDDDAGEGEGDERAGHDDEHEPPRTRTSPADAAHP